MIVIETKRPVPGIENEAGIHTIQRIPPTERRGRVHTSFVTVSVLSHDVPDISFASHEFDIRFHRSTGCGGQRKNKVATCCVITHVPTGLTQKADGRSRLDNQETAMTQLTKRLHQIEMDKAHGNINDVRCSQIGNAERGDKRRTYRFRDDVVIDHITGKKSSCKSFMRGNINLLW